MIVIDASAIVEVLAHGPMADSISEALTESKEAITVPHLLDIEALNALRGLAIAGEVDGHEGSQFLESLESLRAERVAHADLLPRVWELRHNFTAYDATYIALAEAQGATLWTCDAKLVKGHRAKVRLFRTH